MEMACAGGNPCSIQDETVRDITQDQAGNRPTKERAHHDALPDN